MSETQADEEKIRRALNVSLWVGLGFVFLIGALFWLAEMPAPQPEIVERQPVAPQATVAADAPEFKLTDVTAVAGIDFVHENGAYGERLLPETMGGGVAFLDYDNDGDQDLFLVNSKHWPKTVALGAAPNATVFSRLYRNRGDGTFEDVSTETGADLSTYGMGVAAGDYDGDGFVDLFVTAVGANTLLQNEGGERFVDVTDGAGVAGAGSAWSTSAAFFDYDRDGDLDLFVANYVQWSPEIDRAVNYQIAGLGRAYGPPTDFAGTHSYLYRNDGGRFTDVSAEAGIEVANATTGQPVGKALAVHPLDVDGDGWLDLAVANDTVRNFLFINDRAGGFREDGIGAGMAFDPAGLATGAMGIDGARFANDERLAIMIGNFANEMSSFYVGRGEQAVFSDDAIVSGIGAPSRRALSFGLAFLDLDLDGRLDVLAANGHVEPDINKVQSSQQYEQEIQLFWNCGPRCARPFQLVQPSVGRPLAGRGLAYADIDGDGDLDVIVTAVGGRPQLLRNDQDGGNWVRFRLESDASPIGATVVLASEAWRQERTVMPARSYLSQVELPVTFGTGGVQALSAEIRWPDGSVQTLDDVAPNRLHVVTKP